MKYMKRAEIYKASNVTFNPQSKRAYSYSWWRFVDVINGSVVFNSYRYSPSTGKHQSKVRSLMAQLNIEIDHFVECPKGLQNCYWAESSLDLYLHRILELEAAMAKKGSRKAKNREREEQIARLRARMSLVSNLGKISKSKQREIELAVREHEAKRKAVMGVQS